MPKILLIRFSSIGDIVLTSPIIRALRQQLNAELHFLCKRSFASLLEHHPDIHRIHTYDGSFRQLIPILRKESYDSVVDLHKNLRSQRVCLALGRPVYRFDKLNWQKWLMVNFKTNRLPDKHLVDRYFEGIQSLNVVNDGRGLDYHLPNEILEESYQNFAASFESKSYLCLALGAAHATKQIPATLIRSIIKLSRFRIALLGGPNEAAIGEQLASEFGEKVKNLAGKISIAGSAKIILESLAVITPDTGMMHISAALKVPIVAVWGNTIPEFGMFPYFPENESKFENVQIANLPCRPCSKIGKQSCPKGHFDCMNQILPEQILEAVDRLLS